MPSALKNSQHLRASIATYTGKEFFPLAPRWQDICVDDVAHALSMTCRYNGHCVEFYSVAQHSVLVSRYLETIEPEFITPSVLAHGEFPNGKPIWDPVEVQKWGLFHDAAEAYISDIVAPIKPWIPGYKEMEEQLTFAVARRFDLPWPVPEIVKYADKAIFRSELRSGIMSKGDWWEIDEEHPEAGISIAPLDPGPAERAFHDRYVELFGREVYGLSPR